MYGLRSDKFDLSCLLAMATIFLIVAYHTYLLVATVRTGWAGKASREDPQAPPGFARGEAIETTKVFSLAGLPKHDD